MANDLVVLICGVSKAGKSTSLRHLDNVLLANCEAGKALPYRRKGKNIKSVTVKNPKQMTQFFKLLETDEQYDYGVIDGLNYLMDMYESQFVVGSSDTFSAWAAYGEYLRNMMQQEIAATSKPIIVTAHTRTIYSESAMAKETKVPIKGATQNIGVESYFTSVIGALRMDVGELKEYANELLVITPEEELAGYKHVFQTQPTQDTLDGRISTPMGMFDANETYIDNDVVKLLARMKEYYED